MFTGIIEALGHVVAVTDRATVRVIDIGAAEIAEGMATGDSICVNGACLTAVAVRADGFTLELVPETLAKTTLGALHEGSVVNLERAVMPSTRLGGHFVQGHVEGVGAVVAVDDEGGGARRVRVAAPAELLRFALPKGFIAVDGVSLTVVDVGDAEFSIAFIPHTLGVTIAGGYRVGVNVNLESDILGRYVERLLRTGSLNTGSPGTGSPGTGSHGTGSHGTELPNTGLPSTREDIS